MRPVSVLNNERIRRISMKAKIIFVATLAAAVSGCASIGGVGDNATIYSANQPVVKRSNYAIDVNVDNYQGLAPAETQRVSEWFDALKLGFGDKIAADYGDAGKNFAVQKALVDLAAQHGMQVVETAPVTAGNIPYGTARIVVTRSEASVPNCPNWTKSTESNYNSSNHPNYGCATNSNLAAMVADPEDLVRGRESTIRNDNGAGRYLGRAQGTASEAASPTGTPR
jgi:pilus assembly protein CpaD